MGAPKYEQPPLDPAFAGLVQQTQQQNVEAIQTGLQHDTASLLARYGARLAMAGNASGPSSVPMQPPMMMSA